MEFLKNNQWVLPVVYIIAVNIIGYAMMGIDKARARKGRWRIPEKSLFLVAIIGGSAGTNLGMKHFRHKTKHRSFVYGMPAIFLFQIMMAVMMFVQMMVRK